MSEKLQKRSLDTKPEESTEDWLTTYGDMMTLLLTFFVLLFAMSEIDVKKYEEVASSMKDALEGGLKFDRVVQEEIQSTAQLEKLMERRRQNKMRSALRNVEVYLKKQHLHKVINVKMGTRGLVINIPDKVLFSAGQAQLSPAASPVLLKIVQVLQNFPQQIEVAGYTDDVPLRNSPIFPSNWELSSARACSVVRFFADNGIAPERVVALGFGQYRPIVPNVNAENRARNRRVEIILVEN